MIVAAFIFSAVSVALSAVFQYHYSAIGTSRLFLVGQHLARQRMEELMASGFDTSEVLCAAVPPPILVTFTIRDTPVQVEFTLTNVATRIPVGGREEMNVVVTVSWNEKNRTRNVVYSANLAEPI